MNGAREPKPRDHRLLRAGLAAGAGGGTTVAGALVLPNVALVLVVAVYLAPLAALAAIVATDAAFRRRRQRRFRG